MNRLDKKKNKLIGKMNQMETSKVSHIPCRQRY